MQLLKRFLAAIAGSKKATVTVANMLFVVTVPLWRRLGWDITQEEVLTVVGIGMGYVLAQGWADTGKEAAKVAAPAIAAATTPAKSGKPTVVK